MTITWYKSTFSGSEATCVEVAHQADTVLIRDSKYPTPEASPIVSVLSASWPAFLDLVLSGNSGEVGRGVTVAVNSEGGVVISGAGNALTYTAAEWDAFAKGIADGQFDRR